MRGLLSVCVIGLVLPSAGIASGFYVSNGTLKDANGNAFLIRGVNNPHIWYNTAAYDALPLIAENNVNCVRIVWQIKGAPSRLDQIIKRAIDLKMVPMVELHDATGDHEYAHLQEVVNYWLQHEVRTLVSTYEKYIMVNISNEYGGHKKSSLEWRDDYKKAISQLRNEGINALLVIDASGWGQNAEGPLRFGQELIDHDPNHNLLFSVHMYGSWNDAQKIRDTIAEFKEKNIPLIIGEFGYNHDNGNNNLRCRVDHKILMQACHEHQVGYMAWSWCGNNTENQWLDLTSEWKTLTFWGNEVLNGSYGIKETAKCASIFK